jgi:hypothetical protein
MRAKAPLLAAVLLVACGSSASNITGTDGAPPDGGARPDSDARADVHADARGHADARTDGGDTGTMTSRDGGDATSLDAHADARPDASDAAVDGGPADYPDPTCTGLTLDAWPRDSSGWTVLPSLTHAGRRIIYVSASNAGKTSPDPGNPNVYYATTAEAGVALLRVGMPDSLLFNRGETFNLTASIDSHGLSGGATPDLAKVVGAYGTGVRPILVFSQAHSVIAVESYAVQNLILTQLDLEPSASLTVQGTGMTLSSTTMSHVLVEDVKINGFQKGLDIESGADVVVRRSEILDSCGGFRSQGMYVQSLTGITIDENYMDQNGLQTCGDATSGSPQGQGIYIQSFNACFRARGNVLTRSLGNTLEARIGGDVQGNVFVGSNAALNYGFVLGGSIEGKQMPRGVYGAVTGNVFLNNQEGVTFGNTAHALFANNVMAATVAVEGALYMQSQDGIGIHGLTVSSNSISAAKYFVSYQAGLPAGPVEMKDDGVNTQITDCDGAFSAMDASLNGTLIFKYESTQAGPPVCQVGLEENGADIYTLATASTKVIDSSLTGILMLPTEAPVDFSQPDAFLNNNASVTNAKFEVSTTPESTNPATNMPETNDNLAATFANPHASIADVLGTEAAFYAAMAAQSRDAWNPKITAAAMIPYFVTAYTAQ